MDEGRDMEIDSTGGACMLVRREALKQVGPLDEGFLMYAEETDWCFRIKKAGWKVFYVSGATVYHYGGASAQTEERQKMDKILHQSLLYFCRKHYGFLAYGILFIASLFNLCALLIYRRLTSKS